MIWNDTTAEEAGMVQEMNDICDSDDNSFPLTTKARRTNFALSRFFTLAFKADGRFSWDDVNHGSAPIETLALVNGQQRYDLTNFSTEILNILRVEILDAQGLGLPMNRLNRGNVPGALSEYKKLAGIPDEYDLLGNYMDLYCPPNYDMADGLKLYVNRNKILFLSSDEDRTIPVPSIFEEYICNVASIKFLNENNRSNKNDIQAKILLDEVEIKTFFSNREKGDNSNGKITNRPVSGR